MPKKMKDEEAYGRIVTVLKKKTEGTTVADLVAATALPLEKVKELVPVASDEFGGRLQVTESGEILFSFPNGFRSKYRGFAPTLRRILSVLSKAAIVVGTMLFKVWIAVMLVGYFFLFMAIALVALAASVAVSASSSSDNRSSSRRGGGMGGLFLATRIFDLIIRIWFYSEITKSWNGDYGVRAAKPRRKPLHQAVFSFVFGDGDPNADWDTREKKAVISYIQANRGAISLPEFMALTGLGPREAEERITVYLVEFAGSPEATKDGTIVYRFDDLMRRADKKDRSFFALSAPIKRLKTFSSNTRKMNGWFLALNGINLLFGGYFLTMALGIGPIVSQAQITGSTYLYAVALAIFSGAADPVSFISLVLGAVPIAFAALFYAIPFVRRQRERKENAAVKNENLRKEAYRRIWDTPRKVSPASFNPVAEESKPDDIEAARERVIKELGSYSNPEVEIADDGKPLYSFPELERERKALAEYRAEIKEADSELGETVFDSHA